MSIFYVKVSLWLKLSQRFPFNFSGYIDGYHSHQQANHTRENGPLAEFRTHMLRAISTLSISRQCNILTAILKGSGGDPPRIIDEFMSQVPYEHFPCVPLTTSSGSSVNSSELLRATDFYITRYILDSIRP